MYAVFSLESRIEDGVYLFETKQDAETFIFDSMVADKLITINDNGKYLACEHECDTRNEAIEVAQLSFGALEFLHIYEVNEDRRPAAFKTTWNFGPTPYGTKVDPRDGKKLIACESEMMAIRTIIKRHHEGDSFRAISRWMNGEKNFNRSGKPWHPTQIKRILKREGLV